MRSLRELKMIPFEPGHLASIIPRHEDQKPPEVMWSVLHTGGPAWTGMLDDRILFCTGALIIWLGVAEVWSFCDEECSRYPREVLKYQNEYLDRVIREQKLHRVQAHVRASWRSAYRYIERLGFKREALMLKYGPNGEDFYLYGRVI
jgi:hypothetical protein